jgi:flavin prenyltransferase
VSKLRNNRALILINVPSTHSLINKYRFKTEKNRTCFYSKDKAPIIAIMESPRKYPTVVAITGASGSILGFELVRHLLTMGEPVELIISSHSFQVISEEMNLTLPGSTGQEETILDYLKLDKARCGPLLQCFSNKNIGAPSASGTHLTRGMVIIPCSMTTLGKVACGISDNLVARAADVALKERRKVIVVPRESPFNQVHLENMLRLHQAGAVIIPPVLSFYQEAFQTLEGQINYTLGKVLDHLGLTEHGLFPRWGE